MGSSRTARRRRYSAREHELRRREDLQPEAGQRWSVYQGCKGFGATVAETLSYREPIERGPERRVNRPVRPWEPDRRSTGQALIEFALIVPVLFLAALGFLEAGRLIVTKADIDRSTYAVAQAAADYPDDERWNAVAARLLIDCDADVQRDAMIATATATCRYRAIVFGPFDGLTISSSESAAIGRPDPTPAPSESPLP